MKSGLQEPNRPLGTFLFIGTTGVTELARALSEFRGRGKGKAGG